MPGLNHAESEAGAKLSEHAIAIMERDRIPFPPAFEKAKTEKPELWRGYAKSLSGALKESEQPKRYYAGVPPQMKNTMTRLLAMSRAERQTLAGNRIVELAERETGTLHERYLKVFRKEPGLAEVQNSGELNEHDWETAAALEDLGTNVLDAIHSKYFGD